MRTPIVRSVGGLALVACAATASPAAAHATLKVGLRVGNLQSGAPVGGKAVLSGTVVATVAAHTGPVTCSGAVTLFSGKFGNISRRTTLASQSTSADTLSWTFTIAYSTRAGSQPSGAIQVACAAGAAHGKATKRI